jgi:hypothetical protein
MVEKLDGFVYGLGEFWTLGKRIGPRRDGGL